MNDAAALDPEGVLASFQARYAIDPLLRHAGPLQDGFEARLVEVSGDHLRVSEARVRVSSEVFRALV